MAQHSVSYDLHDQYSRNCEYGSHATKIPSCVIRNIESINIRETKVPEIRKSITLFPFVMRLYNLRFFNSNSSEYSVHYINSKNNIDNKQKFQFNETLYGIV